VSIRVLVVDDHPLFRKGLASTVAALPGMTLAGVAADGEAAVAAVDADRPDVVLMDLGMPGMGGIAATRDVVARAPGIAVLVLTMSEDEQSLFAALRAGARGYLLKGADEDEIARAIAAVAAGEAVFGPAVAGRVLAYLTDQHPARLRPHNPFPQLTPREQEVLGLIGQGLGNAGIARRLVLSPKTVRNHVSNVLSKLHADSRADAVRQAHEAGL
jgi:DNA-binding NarL/FixJ family response regulator